MSFPSNVIQDSLSVQMTRALRAKLLLCFCSLFFFSSLIVLYTLDISRNWYYMGFDLDADIKRIPLSALVILWFCILSRDRSDLTSFFQGFLIFIVLCPASVLFCMAGRTLDYYFVVISGCAAVFLTSSLPVPRVVSARLSGNQFAIALVFVATLVLITIAAFGGLRDFNLNILRVYEFRQSAADRLPKVFGYIVSPVSKVIVPIGFTLGLYYKKRSIACAFAVMAVLLFGMTHHKTILFAPIFVLLTYFFLHKYSVRRGLLIIFVFVGCVALLELIMMRVMGLTASGLLGTLIIRRVILVPSLLDSFYVDFFSDNAKILWSNSKVSLGLSESSYDVTAPFLIGGEYFGRSEMSANTGFIGSGFANFGIVGVLMYGTLLGLLVAILNSHSRSLGHPLTVSMCIMIVMSAMTSSDLVTILLTHGLLLLIVCLSFMPSASEDRQGAMP